MKLIKDGSPTPLMTAEELAEYLQFSISTIYKLLRNGQIPVIRVGGDFRFDGDEINGLLANR